MNIFKRRISLIHIFIILFSLTTNSAFAGGDVINSSNTAWILTSTALVLFMTMPGLALFYGGLVQAKNVLSVLMQCFSIAALMSLIWMVGGYSLAFGDGGPVNGLIGGFDRFMLSGMGRETLIGDIPESVFFMFQMAFAIITPALIVGAYVERVKFSAVLIFSGLWMVLVYVPVCHWVWGGGWLTDMGIMDFAGGLVVHATAGASALVIVKMAGNRRGYPTHLRPPHSPGLTMIGAAMLWVGWYGFNAGSALSAGGDAGMAMLVTHMSAVTGALVWVVIEWKKYGKPSLVGIVTGLVAGLATITPASGFVSPAGGLLIGFSGGLLCYYAVGFIKNRLNLDDSLDVFAVHGLGGILGTLMVAVLGADEFGGAGLTANSGVLSQLGIQATGVAIVVIWSVIVSWVILMVTATLTKGLRASDDDMTQGLDISHHGERDYNF
jgi:Amt family ammonium transporter